MSELTNWKTLTKTQSWGGLGSFGIKIEVAGTHLPKDWENKEISRAIYEAAGKLEDAIRAVAIAEDPVSLAAAKKERENLLACFGDKKIFVQDLPNGYCSRWCCKHLPWFRVTTEVGIIEIGWRKSVIMIDWTDVPGSLKANVLFPHQDVTKFEKGIHAWGYEKATVYLQSIMSSTPIE